MFTFSHLSDIGVLTFCLIHSFIYSSNLENKPFPLAISVVLQSGNMIDDLFMSRYDISISLQWTRNHSFTSSTIRFPMSNTNPNFPTYSDQQLNSSSHFPSILTTNPKSAIVVKLFIHFPLSLLHYKTGLDYLLYQRIKSLTWKCLTSIKQKTWYACESRSFLPKWTHIFWTCHF